MDCALSESCRQLLMQHLQQPARRCGHDISVLEAPADRVLFGDPPGAVSLAGQQEIIDIVDEWNTASRQPAILTTAQVAMGKQHIVFVRPCAAGGHVAVDRCIADLTGIGERLQQRANANVRSDIVGVDKKDPKHVRRSRKTRCQPFRIIPCLSHAAAVVQPDISWPTSTSLYRKSKWPCD